MKDWSGETIWWAVYGVFLKDECLYVGVTKNAFYREQEHKRRFGRKSEFRVLNWTKSKARGSELESRYIRRYKKKGQARFNKNGSNPPINVRPMRKWVLYASKFGDLSLTPNLDYKEITVQEISK